MQTTYISLDSLRGTGSGKPLLVVGAGPSYEQLPVSAYERLGVTVWALNHTITELYRIPGHWWVSNDHDRTFGSSAIAPRIKPRLAEYKPWRTITQRIFCPGPTGDVDWVDHRGRKQGPSDFRLSLPGGSTVIYYAAGEGNERLGSFIYNGHSVLEVALAVADVYGYSPIVLLGCDLSFAEDGSYYAPTFAWKPTPAKILRGKLNAARISAARSADRWTADIRLVSTLWRHPPWPRITPAGALELLQEARDGA